MRAKSYHGRRITGAAITGAALPGAFEDASGRAVGAAFALEDEGLAGAGDDAGVLQPRAHGVAESALDDAEVAHRAAEPALAPLGVPRVGVVNPPPILRAMLHQPHRRGEAQRHAVHPRHIVFGRGPAESFVEIG